MNGTSHGGSVVELLPAIKEVTGLIPGRNRSLKKTVPVASWPTLGIERRVFGNIAGLSVGKNSWSANCQRSKLS